MFYILDSSVVEQLAQNKGSSVNGIIASTRNSKSVLFVDDSLTKLVHMMNADISLKGALIATDTADGLKIMWELYDREKDRWMDNREYQSKSRKDSDGAYNNDIRKGSVQIKAVKFDSSDEAKSFMIVNECLATYSGKISHIISDDRGQIHYIIISYVIE